MYNGKRVNKNKFHGKNTWGNVRFNHYQSLTCI